MQYISTNCRVLDGRLDNHDTTACPDALLSHKFSLDILMVANVVISLKPMKNVLVATYFELDTMWQRTRSLIVFVKYIACLIAFLGICLP